MVIDILVDPDTGEVLVLFAGHPPVSLDVKGARGMAKLLLEAADKVDMLNEDIDSG